MERLVLTEHNVEECAARAADICYAGGIVLYPTDTLYGLGSDALSDEAVAKVQAIKGRDEKKPINCVVADVAMMEQYAEVNDLARTLGARFFPGPLTLILKKKPAMNSGIARNIGTIGFRIPAHPFCIAFARAFNAPVTTTSANIADRQPEHRVDNILAQLGYSNVLKNTRMIDLVVDAGELPERKPSSVIDVSEGKMVVLREGAIPVADIQATAGA